LPNASTAARSGVISCSSTRLGMKPDDHKTMYVSTATTRTRAPFDAAPGNLVAPRRLPARHPESIGLAYGRQIRSQTGVKFGTPPVVGVARFLHNVSGGDEIIVDATRGVVILNSCGIGPELLTLATAVGVPVGS